MTLGLLTAVDHRHEADLVAALEGSNDVRVVRRCADAAELVSVAAAGTGDVAVVSVTFRGIDRELLRTLAGHGVRVVGMCERSDEPGERVLRQLGVARVVHPDTPPEEIVAALAVDEGGQGPAPTTPATAVTTPGGDAHPAGRLGAAPGVGASSRGGAHHPGSVPSPSGSGATGPEAPLGAGGDAGGGARPSDSPHPDGGVAEPAQPGEPRRPGIVIAVWGPVGSPGRTTLAVNLAAELAAAGTATLLVDADTWGASVGQVLGLLDEAPGLAAATRLSEQGALDVAALARVAPEVAPRLRVLTGLPRADRWPEARAGAVGDLLAVARHLVEVVVVDCGFAVEDDEELSYDTVAPRRNAATLTVLERADQVVLVGAADPVGLQRLARAAEELGSRTSGIRTVVVNKVRASVDGPGPERAITQVLSRFSGLTDLTFLPWAPAECDLALWEGRTLADVAPEGALVREVRRLAGRLVPGAVTRSPSRRRRRAPEPV
jgi:Flp pilus assembly CpaE family ATPase